MGRRLTLSLHCESSMSEGKGRNEEATHSRRGSPLRAKVMSDRTTKQQKRLTFGLFRRLLLAVESSRSAAASNEMRVYLKCTSFLVH